MKKLFATILLMALPCWAQEITGIVANVNIASVGEEVRFTVNLAVLPGTEPWCGLSVDFGDGGVNRAPVRDMRDIPFVTSHTYKAPGTYAIRVEGISLTRGLRSVLPCDGSRRTVVVNIVDAKKAQEEEQRLREIEKREAEIDAKEQEFKIREDARIKAEEDARKKRIDHEVKEKVKAKEPEEEIRPKPSVPKSPPPNKPRPIDTVKPKPKGKLDQDLNPF